ncbi:uncharacterized protein LOC135842899 [Planococcus citri]|uniref:uncharacterized protein LOC135842899 n=1 Tax=Planococcus citri TaxID=170843 RepID=UPI0031F735E2
MMSKVFSGSLLRFGFGVVRRKPTNGVFSKMYHSRKAKPAYEGVPASLYNMLTIVENYKKGTDILRDYQKEFFEDHLEIKEDVLSEDEHELNSIRVLAVETMEDTLRTEGKPNLRKFLADNPESLSESDKSKLLNILDYRDKMIADFKMNIVSMSTEFGFDGSDKLLALSIVEDMLRTKGIPNLRTFLAGNPKSLSKSDKSKLLKMVDHRDQLIVVYKNLSKYFGKKDGLVL